MDRDLSLRLFFSTYASISAASWYFDRTIFGASPWLNNTVPFVSDDLSGRYSGLDVSYLAFDWTWLKHSAWKHVLLATIVVSAAAFLTRRWREYGYVALLIGLQILAYAIGRRRINFDMITLSFMAYGLGLLLNVRAGRARPYLPWTAACATLFTIYSIAFISKIRSSGWEWADPYRVGMLMHVGVFRNDVGTSPFRPPQILMDFFAGPTVISQILLLGLLVTEGVGVFMVLSRRGRGFYALALVGLHLSMFVSVAILFRSVVGLLMTFALPALKGAPESRRDRGTAFAISLLLAAFCFVLPTSAQRSNVALFQPFGRFGMFSWGAGPYTLYYFKNEAGDLVPARDVSQELRVSVGSFNSMLLGTFPIGPPSQRAARYSCSFIQREAPPAGKLNSQTIYIWSRYVYVHPVTRRVDTSDRPLLRCPLPEES